MLLMLMVVVPDYSLYTSKQPPVCGFYFGGKGKGEGKGKFFPKKSDGRTFPSHPFISLRNKTERESKLRHL